MDFPIRINKYLKEKGVASRREADQLIEKELVKINGEIVKKGVLVREGDRVEVGKIDKDYRYLAYYKPRGLPTQDLPGKESVITVWKKENLYPVGRLDKESEGLLLLTNDGRFATKVLSQKEEWEKEYVVTVREELSLEVKERIEKGMRISSLGQLLPAKTTIVNKHTLKIVLKEGKRHQIRIMLNELGYTVTSLKRVRVGDIRLGSLKPNQVRKINL